MNNSAIAAAKRRRAGPPTTTAPSATCSVPPRQPQQQQQQQGQRQGQQQQQQPIPSSHKILSLKEVMAYYDSRILYLENVVKSGAVNVASNTPSVQELMNEHILEFDHRYELLATEIEDLKDAFMKLQTFTMDINKTLEEERNQVKPEPIVNEEPVAVIEQTTVPKSKKGRNNVTVELDTNL